MAFLVYIKAPTYNVQLQCIYIHISIKVCSATICLSN